MNEYNHLWWGVAWLLATAAVFIGPLLPGLVELRKRRDAKPMAIDSVDNGDTDYRIKLLAPQFPVMSTLANADAWLSGNSYRLPAGTRLSAARTDLDVILEREAVADILITDRSLEMEEGSQVTHLAHAQSIRTHGAAVLNGRASAESLVVLAPGSHVFRVAAPCIVTAPLQSAPEVEPGAATPLVRLPQRHEGNLKVDAGQRLEASLVVTGDLVLEEGAVVVGHVKAHGRIELAPGARVEGALFAQDSIRCVGRNRVQGPLSAARRVELGEGTIAGSPLVPCSVSAWDVLLGPGVAVFGTITSVGGCDVVRS